MNPLTSIEQHWKKLSSKEKYAVAGGGVLLIGGVLYLRKTGGKVPAAIATKPVSNSSVDSRPVGYGGGSIPGVSSSTMQNSTDNALAIARLNADNVAKQIAANERIAEIRAKQATDTAWINAGVRNAQQGQAAANRLLGGNDTAAKQKQNNAVPNFAKEVSKLFQQEVEDDQLLRDIDRILEDEGPYGSLIPETVPEGSVETESAFSFDIPSPVDTDYTVEGFFTQWGDGNENVGVGPSVAQPDFLADDYFTHYDE